MLDDESLLTSHGLLENEILYLDFAAPWDPPPEKPGDAKGGKKKKVEVNTTRRAAGRRAAGAPLALPPSPRALQHASLHSLSLSRCPMDVRIARAVTQTQVLSIPSAAA